MTNKIWKMCCVVGLVLAAPTVGTATTIPDAVAAADDGMYVRMDYGSSITLTFNPPVTFGESGGTVVVYLCGLSKSIRISSGSWYNDFYDESGYNGAWQVWLPEGTWSSLTIKGVPQFSDFVVYLDAVQVFGTGQPGGYSAHTDPVTPFGPPPEPEPDPIAMIGDLIVKVAEFNLHQGIENSLDAKLDAALGALEDVNVNNDASAVNKLQAFINEVNAQRNKKITIPQADELVADAQAIIAVLTAP